ncbi:MULTISPECIES: sensor histidine kinase [Gordonibacter]|uniref:Sensor-like histidine kinase SenX3 n=1 Tax=Gordonibacter faecis TaxID=3047475 RepID=A0ABT7DKK2_9ACTN|nr:MULTISPECIES: HAMP domain-containing sensor histidine kinase [unclassified Gordonibacter]MDJ1650048.1 HAMP domain-containing sensor histidine kinase [Gordonibacter sp. KGMB12511]
MRKKISESIELKTFLGMLALLVACCALIYAMVAVFLPRNYQTEIEGQVSSDFSELVALLEDRGWRSTEQDVLEFSVRNNASVQIVDEEGAETYSVNFADAESVSSPGQTMSLSARFSEGGRAYHVQANVSLVAVSQASGILLGLLPAVSVAILAISALGAFSCARYYSKPLLRISGVAKRMASLDMTWKCEENRADEIGVLAASLNEMSEKLERTMGELKQANEGLRRDIEREREQERERIDFFTSVSHELKTPIAVLKGELEGMIYSVGEFKDRDTYLRHCLETTNEMESAVREIISAARASGDFSPMEETVDVGALTVAVCDRLDSLAQTRDVRLWRDVRSGCPIKGDASLVEKAIANVVENAITHSEPGALVSVGLASGVLKVENSGAHIDEADLPRLFEPFFRVDRSRSRESGGTGLGLYIAKVALDRHGVACSIQNTDEGVAFTADFRRAMEAAK